MKKHYDNFYRSDLAVCSLSGEDQSERNDFAKDNFRPMYYIKMYPDDLTKLEMCFDCTNYQAQFPPSVPFENHVFQTIFLDRDGSEGLWTWGDIRGEKRMHEKWWKQQSHRWQHYAGVVPGMMWINGKHHTQ